MKRWIVVAAAALCALSGCAGNETSKPSPAATVTVTATPAVTSSSSPSRSPSPISAMNATRIANVIRKKVPGIRRLTVITEDNDANNLIGRPGGYTSAAVLTDRFGDTSDSEPGVAWGATVEIFPTQTAAQERKDYIQSVLTSSPMLGTEYDYVSDNALLRVTGEIKPSRARQYESALRSIPTD